MCVCVGKDVVEGENVQINTNSFASSFLNEYIVFVITVFRVNMFKIISNLPTVCNPVSHTPVHVQR